VAFSWTASAQPAPVQPSAPACTAKLPAFCPIVDRPGLPRVLLIGDSVSIGYTFKVRALLANVANVHRIPQNGGSTRIGLINLDSWLEGPKYDVIHVNFGLHDAEYGPMGGPKVDLPTYAQNVKTIIEKLKSTGARVIWATTTPVPADALIAHGQRKGQWGDVVAYNKEAVQTAQSEGVGIDDLYGVIKPHEAELQRPQNVHFNPDGSEALAESVAASIRAALASKH
jgi:acyl-CoA thioesterase-1